MLSESLLIAFDCPPSADDWTLLNKSSMFKFTTGSTKELKAGTELDDFLVEKIRLKLDKDIDDALTEKEDQ